MKMPNAMSIKFTKLIFAISAITVLGGILSIISRDRTLLYLSGGVALAGSMKIIDFYRSFKEDRFECVEGILIEEQPAIARRRHTIVLEQEDGQIVRRILEGRYRLKLGVGYRFYLKTEPAADASLELPEMLQPAQVVLGHEEASFLSGKQI